MSDNNEEADRTQASDTQSAGEQPVNPSGEQPDGRPTGQSAEQATNQSARQLAERSNATDTKEQVPLDEGTYEDDVFDEHHKRRRGRGHRGRRGGPPMSGQHRSRARRGAVIGAILNALEDGPNHGYGIMDKLENLSEGRWRPSPGSVYPTLGRLAHKGLIAEVPDSDPKEFELTDEGRAWLAEKGASFARDASPFPSGENHGLRGAVSQLAGAAKQVGRYGTETQRLAAIELVEATTRKLYASMAEAPPVGSDASSEAETD